MVPPKGRGVGFFSAAFYGQAGRMRWWLFVCQGNPSREVRTERRAAASDNHAFPPAIYQPFVCLQNAKYIHVARSDLLSTRCPLFLVRFLFILFLLFSSSFFPAFANSSRTVKSLCACSGIFLTEFDNPLRMVHISFT